MILPSFGDLMRYFNSVGIAETCSTITLYFIAMPFKYLFGNQLLVEIVGPIHGLLWIMYVGFLGFGCINGNWNLRAFFTGGFLSILPGGPIWLERRIHTDRFQIIDE